jgi:hypothetical protein
MSRRKAKGLLRAAGILEQLGDRWYVGEARLRERLPDVYDRVYAYIVLTTVDDSARRRTAAHDTSTRRS